jgi:Flp pilus assembly protein TadD
MQRPLLDRRLTASVCFPIKRSLSVTLSIVLAGCAVSGSQPVGVQEQIAVGEQFISAGEYDSAYAILDGIAETQGTQPDALVAIGDSYLRADALLRAETAYAKAAALGDRNNSEIGMGKVALKRNNAEQAMLHFQNALKRDPTSTVAWNGLGVAYDLAGNHSEAQNSYLRAIDLRPDYFEAINNLGLSQTLAGNSARAIETLTALTGSRLDSTTTRVNLAIALEMAGHHQQAADLARTEMPGEDSELIFASVKSYVRQTP